MRSRISMSWIFAKWAEFEQKGIGNMKLCHLKHNSETSTRADRQNASVVRTLFDLFIDSFILSLFTIGNGFASDSWSFPGLHRCFQSVVPGAVLAKLRYWIRFALPRFINAHSNVAIVLFTVDQRGRMFYCQKVYDCDFCFHLHIFKKIFTLYFVVSRILNFCSIIYDFC